MFSDGSMSVLRCTTMAKIKTEIRTTARVAASNELPALTSTKTGSIAVRLLQEHTNDNEVVFSGLTRHDKILINDTMLYFVAKRQPATKWDLLAPGLQTTAAIQNEMVSELESKRPPFVVLESDWDNIKEPNGICE
jgi:hypothetical protein